MSQVLYRKWRPQTWEQVIGQNHVILTLRNALAAGKGAHAYLFAGPRGTGKTSTARILAKAVNCLDEDLTARPCGVCSHCQAVAEGRFLDLIEIDAASNTSVDDVRDLREKINFAPNQARYKVYIIDEVHMLSNAAFNALLKTLEEPPPHAIFVLATTEVHKIPATVLSRCQWHEFRRIPQAEIVAALTSMAESEGIEIEDDALKLIARQSTGAMRDAISLLDQLASSGQSITLEMAQQVLGTATNRAVMDLVGALLDEKASAGLDCIHQALDAGSDARQFSRQVVDYLRDLLLILMGDESQVDVSVEERNVMQKHSQAFDAPRLLEVIRIFNRSAWEARNAWQPALPLEIAFIEALECPRMAQPAAQPLVPQPTPAPTPRKSGRIGDQEVEPASQKLKAVPHAEESAPADLPESADRQATQSLEKVWNQVIAHLRQVKPQAQGLLNSCTSYYLRGDVLVMNFASELLKKMMEKGDNISATEQAVSQVLGRQVTIKCGVDTMRRKQIPPGVEEDGMVAAAVRDLGGEIVDIQ